MSERTTERPGSLMETHKGYDPRILFFYPLIAVLLLVLVGGFAYQQLFKADIYHERERQQNWRRILMPGPRGDIYDREGRPLVINRARFSVSLNLDELRKDIRTKELVIRKNYRALDDKDLPTRKQIFDIARYTVVQGYLDQVNRALGRNEKVDAADLDEHFNSQLLLPYVLIDDLQPNEFALLVEQLPVVSPLQVYAANTRSYPYKSAAAHTLGYVRANDDISIKDFPGAGLSEIKMKGTIGKDGLESKFENQLQGQTGGTIYRVNPKGYRVHPPLERRVPLQGKSLTTSLDIDLQLAAEEAMTGGEDGEGNAGSAVAIDIATGEVLVLASKPDYNLNDFSPRLTSATITSLNEKFAWSNRAIQALYPPGSTFKILTAIAGIRSGVTQPDSKVNCLGTLQIGNRSFPCHNGHSVHGLIELSDAIAQSCNIFFATQALAAGPQAVADEARRFHMDRRTGIELPNESGRMLVPDPAWKLKMRDERWTPGDTANVSIGQGALLVTPLEMACFTASVARGETFTPPTLVHLPDRPRLHTEPIGITPAQHAAVIEGMRRCIESGTGSRIITRMMKLDALKIAGKTGTAQAPSPARNGKQINIAWFIGFAPSDNPKIAIAVAMEGDKEGEEYGGGLQAAPIAGAIFKKWGEKQQLKSLLPPITAAAK